MKAIDTATTKRAPRPLWGLVTDAVYRRIGDRYPLWGVLASEVRRFLRLSGLDFRPYLGGLFHRRPHGNGGLSPERAENCPAEESACYVPQGMEPGEKP